MKLPGGTRVLLCYASGDREAAHQLRSDLEGIGCDVVEEAELGALTPSGPSLEAAESEALEGCAPPTEDNGLRPEVRAAMAHSCATLVLLSPAGVVSQLIESAIHYALDPVTGSQVNLVAASVAPHVPPADWSEVPQIDLKDWDDGLGELYRRLYSLSPHLSDRKAAAPLHQNEFSTRPYVVDGPTFDDSSALEAQYATPPPFEEEASVLSRLARQVVSHRRVLGLTTGLSLLATSAWLIQPEALRDMTLSWSHDDQTVDNLQLQEQQGSKQDELGRPLEGSHGPKQPATEGSRAIEKYLTLTGKREEVQTPAFWEAAEADFAAATTNPGSKEQRSRWRAKQEFAASRTFRLNARETLAGGALDAGFELLATARKLVESSVQRAPGWAAGHIEYASLLMDAGEHDAAEDAARKAQRLAPGSWLAAVVTAEIHLRRGKLSRALGELQHAQSLAPDAHLSQGLLAVAYHRSGQTARAVKLAQTVSRNAPHLWAPMEVLALAALDSQDLVQANIHTEKLLAAVPLSPHAWFLRAEVLRLGKRPREAEAHEEKALALVARVGSQGMPNQLLARAKERRPTRSGEGSSARSGSASPVGD